MLKIMEVHPSHNPMGEYVVLQNIGLVTVNLRGCAICTEEFLTEDLFIPGEVHSNIYIFRDEIALKPYMRVVLFTGHGKDDWVPTVDGKMAYCAFWNRGQSVWNRSHQVHVLQLTTSRRVPVPLASPLSEHSANTGAHRPSPSAQQDETARNDADLTRAELERQRGCTFVSVGETEW